MTIYVSVLFYSIRLARRILSGRKAPVGYAQHREALSSVLNSRLAS